MLERTTDERWLANAYLVADQPGGQGFLVDLNERLDPLLEAADRHQVTITHILVTHEHDDHVVEVERVRERLGATVVAHRLAAPALPVVDRLVDDRERLEIAGMSVEIIHLGGHSAGQVAFVVDGRDCFTADALFRGTVGGQREPGPAAFEEVRASVMERLLALDRDTNLHPGHASPTTVAHETRTQPIRASLAWSRPDGSRTLPGGKRFRVGGHAGAQGAGLRRRHEGVGPVSESRRRHHRRVTGPPSR